jgi:hypothetical protein
MSDKVRVPQYLHLPLQILWFDTEEVSVIIVSYLIGLLFGGLSWLLLVLLPCLYIWIKRQQPRGYLVHTLHRLGFAKLTGYPGPQAREFYE